MGVSLLHVDEETEDVALGHVGLVLALTLLTFGPVVSVEPRWCSERV